jgi:hypothetical protein
VHVFHFRKIPADCLCHACHSFYVLRQQQYPGWDDGYGLQPQGGKVDDVTVIVHRVSGDSSSATCNSRGDELWLEPGVRTIFGQQRRAKIAQQQVSMAWQLPCFGGPLIHASVYQLKPCTGGPQFRRLKTLENLFCRHAALAMKANCCLAKEGSPCCGHHGLL